MFDIKSFILPRHHSFTRRLATFSVAIVFATGAMSAHALKLLSTPPPTLEEASFIIVNKSLNSSSWPITIGEDCDECPRKLNLTANSSIKKDSPPSSLSAQELRSGIRYNTIYISYDPDTMNVLRVLLK